MNSPQSQDHHFDTAESVLKMWIGLSPLAAGDWLQFLNDLIEDKAGAAAAPSLVLVLPSFFLISPVSVIPHIWSCKPEHWRNCYGQSLHFLTFCIYKDSLCWIRLNTLSPAFSMQQWIARNSKVVILKVGGIKMPMGDPLGT